MTTKLGARQLGSGQGCIYERNAKRFLIQVGLNVIVIGGASRNLITHLFWNEPFSARNAYRNVRARFGSLLGAAILMVEILFAPKHHPAYEERVIAQPTSETE